MKLMIQAKAMIRVAFGVGALVALINPATAELLISGAAGLNGFAVGAKFTDDHVFKLPPNSEIRLLRSPDNTPFVMRGPYEGTLSHFIDNCNGILASVRSYCQDTAGDRPPVGATRGLRHRDN
jgi:hypothetical protein